MSDAHFRDFDAELAERESPGPVTFRLNGVTFKCKDPMPLGSILVMTRHAGDESIEAQRRQASLLWDFVQEDQHDELDEAIQMLPDLTVMQSILEHIVTSSTGRPTPGS